MGGFDLQELCFTLVNEDEEKEFVACAKVLDDYFAPKLRKLIYPLRDISFER